MAPTQPPPTVTQRLARALLAAFGWSVDIRWPAAPKAVIIVYPHTSNWDFVVGMLARFAAGIPVSWVGKDTLFRWPFGALWRRMGGIPVNRRVSTGFIAQLEAELRAQDRVWLAMSPEGTRKRTGHWRSGFYHLARAIDAPVGLAFIDYRERLVALRDYVGLSGEPEADLARLRAFYAGKVARHPEQAGEIRFR